MLIKAAGSRIAEAPQLAVVASDDPRRAFGVVFLRHRITE
jgi:hypothetical protein